MNIFISVMLIGGIIISLRARQKKMMWRSQHISRSLAQCISQLVGTAGGIYLSLELLLTFLGIPESVWNPPSVFYFKPLAVFSLFIAIFQPFAESLIDKIQKGRG